MICLGSGYVALKNMKEIWSQLDAVQYYGLCGKIEMIVVLTTSILLILLTLYFFVVFGWTLGPFSRKKQQKISWGKEAPQSEELLKRPSTEASAGRLWINVYVIKIRWGLLVPAVRYTLQLLLCLFGFHDLLVWMLVSWGLTKNCW